MANNRIAQMIASLVLVLVAGLNTMACNSAPLPVVAEPPAMTQVTETGPSAANVRNNLLRRVARESYSFIGWGHLAKVSPNEELDPHYFMDVSPEFSGEAEGIVQVVDMYGALDGIDLANFVFVYGLPVDDDSWLICAAEEDRLDDEQKVNFIPPEECDKEPLTTSTGY